MAPAHANEETSARLKLAKELVAAGYPQLARDQLLPMLAVPSPGGGEHQEVWQRLLNIAWEAGGRWILRDAAAATGSANILGAVHDEVDYLIGVNALEAGDLEAALAAFRNVERSAPSGQRAAYLRGLIRMKRGEGADTVLPELGRARTRYSSATTADEERPRRSLQPGQPFYRLRMYSAVREDPLPNQIFVYLAQYYFGLGRYDKTEEYLDWLLKWSVHVPEAVLIYGWTKIQQGQSGPEDLKWLEKYHRSLGTRLSPEFLYVLGIVRNKNQQPVLPLGLEFEKTNAPVARALRALTVDGVRDDEAVDGLREAVRNYAKRGVAKAPWTPWVLANFAANRELMDADHVAVGVAAERKRLSQDRRYQALAVHLNQDATERARSLALTHANLLLPRLQEWGQQMTELLEAEALERLIAEENPVLERQ